MLKSFGKMLYHIAIFALSAAAALSLPYVGRFIARNYQTYWSLIEGEGIFLILVEIGLAVLLILFFNFLGRSWKDRKLASMSAKAGLVLVTNLKTAFAGSQINRLARRRLKLLKENKSLLKEVMLLGSTGFSTFANPDGDLHNAIRNCREAKIMLLNPFGEGANLRAKGIPASEVTPEIFRDQIVKSIEFLKDLNSVQQNIKLKLYSDAPLLKIAVFGDYISVTFYPAGQSANQMSEYIFRHTQDNSDLYNMFYQIFLSRWRDSNIPEYDFDTGELVYRDASGNESRRERLEDKMSSPAWLAR
ncbi:MAG: hypothetical protein ABFD50_06525 [Smithella sp.]